MKSNRGNRAANRPQPFGNNRMSGGNRNPGSMNVGRQGLLELPKPVSGGPLATEHLQLQDLDLELALLRRKREIIEQQQSILIGDNKKFNDYKPPSLFSQQQFSQPTQYGQASNFSRYYDSAFSGESSSRDEPYRQGLKRPSNDPWQGAPSKRIGPKDRLGPPPRQQHSAPKPLMRETFRPPKSASNNQSSANRRIPPLMGRTTFASPKNSKPKLSGVTKPNNNKTGPKAGQGSAPNKLNSYPQSTRQNLVAKAADLTQNQKPPRNEKLESNKQASRSLTGRLELALGSVFKELKQQYGESETYAVVFRGNVQQRTLKQAIRTRIRSVMLGKVVGQAAEIAKMYREKYPAEHDEEMLQLALKVEQPQRRILPFKVYITEDPGKYFRVNFDTLLGKQLEKIFEEVSKVLEADPNTQKPLDEVFEAELSENGISVISDEKADGAVEKVEKKEGGVSESAEAEEKPKEEPSAEAKTEQAATETQEAGEATETQDDKSNVTQEDKSNITQTDESNVTQEDKSNVTQADESTLADESNVTQLDESNVTPDESNVTQADDSNITQADESIDNSIEEGKIHNPEWYRHRFYCRLFENIARRRLPFLLPRYKEQLIKVLNKDERFREGLNIIKEESLKLCESFAQKKANRASGGTEVATADQNSAKTTTAEQTSGEKTAAEQTSNETTSADQISPEKKPAGRFPYFVKVLGRPSLPKRKLMQTFLDQFHPKTIKKHRGIHNLLFVGFSDKQDFDNILAAHKTVVGSSTIEVRVSDATAKANTSQTETNDNPKTEEANNASKNSEDGEESQKNDNSVLNESLDNQIDDLLTSIREEDEKVDTEAKNETEGKVESENAEGETENAGSEVAETEKMEAETDVGNTEAGMETETGKPEANTNGDAIDKVENVQVGAVKNEAKETGRATPTRASARKAATTPAASTIRTRRTSKMAQN